MYVILTKELNMEAEMNKFIKWGIICLLLIVAIAYSMRYMNAIKIQKQEETSMKIMENQFVSFISTWDLSKVPDLFINGTDIKQIEELTPAIMETLGKCQLKTVSYCESKERNKVLIDEYQSKNGYSISCPFVLTCEKANASGTAIFQPDETSVRMFKFELNVE